MKDEQRTKNRTAPPQPTEPESAFSPPYIPWKTLAGFVEMLKNSHPPDVIDSSVMPTSMAGGLQRQLRAALKFLGLTNAAGKVSAGFNELILAHGSPGWPMAIKEHVLQAYNPIIKDLPIDKATPAQLDACFKEKGVSGQMLDKVVRFYLHALKAADVKYSSHLSIRKEARTPGLKKPKTKENPPKAGRSEVAQKGNGMDDAHQHGLIDFPLHFGDKPTGTIRVPPTMDDDDMDLFDAMVAAVKAYATRKKAAAK